MKLDDFIRVAETFADEDNPAVISDSHLSFQMRGRLVEADISGEPDNVKVIHEDEEWPAALWILSYLAKLDRLADRIINYFSPPENYIPPKIELLEGGSESTGSIFFPDSITGLRKYLTDSSAGMTSVYFLTSESGEGKTSLIEKISLEQAIAFKNREANSLILPMYPDGEFCQHFNSIALASISSDLHFLYLYHASFLELVRMNAIIPAFDGFEDTLVDVKSDESTSAISQLISHLSSEGTLLIAAKKTYFESPLRSQDKLLDFIRSERDVQIQQIVLHGWGREEFLAYASGQGISEPSELYDSVKAQTGVKDHPLLTRALLVRKLTAIAKEGGLAELLQRLGHLPSDFLSDFIAVIVEKEFKENWVDESGTGTLLTLEQLHELLSKFALEMWSYEVGYFRYDMVEYIVEYFVKEKGLNPSLQWQIAERITDHPLFCKDHYQGAIRSIIRIRFDHEDVQKFYLSQALARILRIPDRVSEEYDFDDHMLPQSVIRGVAHALNIGKESTLIADLLRQLQQMSQHGKSGAYTRENCGALMLELVEHAHKSYSIRDAKFPVNSLQDRNLQSLTISDSVFAPTSLDKSRIMNCKFDGCHFAELIIHHEYGLDGTVFNNCTFDSAVIYNNGSEEYPQVFFNADRIHSLLKRHGINLEAAKGMTAADAGAQDVDHDMKIALQFMRMFNRTTVIDASLITHRFPSRADYLLNKVLPELQRIHLVKSVKSANKLRLMVPLSRVYQLVENSGGTFKEFVREASARELAEHDVW